MRRAETSPPEEGRDSRARVSRLFAGDHAARVFKLGLVVAAAFVSGVALSHNLRFPTSRTFPCAPLRNFSTLTQMQTSALGVGMASMEIFVGCGLWPSFMP